MICAKCGENNLDDARFCKKCGTPLEKASPTPPPPVAATRSPLEGLGSPSESLPAAQASFTVSKTDAPRTKPTPVKAVPPAAPPTEAKAVDPPPPPPPAAPPIEAKAADSTTPPPPPTVEPAPPLQKKSQKKPVMVCLSIVGIVLLLFTILVIAAMCMGNTETSYLSGPGDTSIFTVDVSEPTQVTVEVPDNAQFNVAITGPQGDFVGDWTVSPNNNVFTLQRNGTYTFNVYSVNGSGWWKAKW